jgi:hypothetical protein
MSLGQPNNVLRTIEVCTHLLPRAAAFDTLTLSAKSFVQPFPGWVFGG